jgi:hypothetical protein
LSTTSCSNDTSNDLSSIASQEEISDRYPVENTKSPITVTPEQPIESVTEEKNEPIIESKALVETGMKRKLVDYDDTDSESEEESKIDSPMEVPRAEAIPKVTKANADLPIALRRTRRGRRALNIGRLNSSSSSAVSLPRVSVSHETTSAIPSLSRQSEHGNQVWMNGRILVKHLDIMDAFDVAVRDELVNQPTASRRPAPKKTQRRTMMIFPTII